MSSDFKKRIRSRIPNPSNTISHEYQKTYGKINKNLQYNNKVYIFDRKSNADLYLFCSLYILKS